MRAGPTIEHATQRAEPAGDGGGERRGNSRDLWASVAPSWGEHATYVDERAAGLTAAMLAAAELRPGDRVLEAACGAGGVGLAAAERVGPGGEVVVSDVAAEMVAIASARAEALGRTNVRGRVLDLDHVDEPDGSFDAVLCREGLMFAGDPGRAVAELVRVLRPGGRAAVAVWGPRERNPWLGLVLDAVSAQLGRPVPPPGVPGPFALSDAATLAELLRDAGLTDVAVDEQPVPLRAGSVDEWWARTTALAGPLARLLAALTPADSRELGERARTAVRRYETPAGLELPGIALLARGRRP